MSLNIGEELERAWKCHESSSNNRKHVKLNILKTIGFLFLIDFFICFIHLFCFFLKLDCLLKKLFFVLIFSVSITVVGITDMYS